jgi:hypothetical protein
MNENGNKRSREFPIVCIGMSAGALPPLEALFGDWNRTPAGICCYPPHTDSPDLVTRNCVALDDHASGVVSNELVVHPIGERDNDFRQLLFAPTKIKAKRLDQCSNDLLGFPFEERAPGDSCLSGCDADGAAALRKFREKGGLTIVQAPGSAERPEMPMAAIDAGFADFILDPDEMAATLQRAA